MKKNTIKNEAVKVNGKWQITYNDVVYTSAAQWARKVGYIKGNISAKLAAGFTPDEIVEQSKWIARGNHHRACKFTFRGVEYPSKNAACITFNTTYTRIASSSLRSGRSFKEQLEKTISNLEAGTYARTRYEFSIFGRTYYSVRECIAHYGLNYASVYNYKGKHKCDITTAIIHFVTRQNNVQADASALRRPTTSRKTPNETAFINRMNEFKQCLPRDCKLTVAENHVAFVSVPAPKVSRTFNIECVFAEKFLARKSVVEVIVRDVLDLSKSSIQKGMEFALMLNDICPGVKVSYDKKHKSLSMSTMSKITTKNIYDKNLLEDLTAFIDNITNLIYATENT